MSLIPKYSEKKQYIINLDFKTADTIILTIQMIIILNTFGVAILLKKTPTFYVFLMSNQQPHPASPHEYEKRESAHVYYTQ